MNFENVFKSLITTALGAVMMAVAFYGWYTEWLSDYEALGGGLIGFALLFMRDSIPQYIGQLFQALIEKFKK